MNQGPSAAIYLNKPEKQYKILFTETLSKGCLNWGIEESLLKLGILDGSPKGYFEGKIMTKTSLLLGGGENPTTQKQKIIICLRIFNTKI